MKKLFALLAVALGVVACQKDQADMGVNLGGEQEVMINVSLPEETRANSADGFNLASLEDDDDYQLRYILEIYRKGAEEGKKYRDVRYSDDTSVSFPVRLVPGYEYTFAVWADVVEQVEDAPGLYYNAESLKSISIIGDKWTAMDEKRDAFYGVVKDATVSAVSTITLKRPFAKIRVISTDIAVVRNLGLAPTNVSVKYLSELYTSFDAVSGAAVGATTSNKDVAANYDTAKYADFNTNEATLFADYIFVPANGTIQFAMEVFAGTNEINDPSFTTPIPVEVNKVTTIKGDVLTEGGNVSVKIENELGVKETYTYISDGAELIKAMTKDGKNILGNDIIVTEADLTRAQRNSATRAAANEPKNTVINLNGYTISVKNTGSGALVTVDEGNTLTFAGEGNIVMDEDSTAPFVENDNNNATIIIEQATVTNESTNQGAVVVDGNAIVNAAADVDEDAVSGDVKPQLEYVLANGGEVTLFEDATSDKILEIKATSPVVIDLNGKTFTFTSNRGFRVMKDTKVVIKNGKIINTAAGGRCIETREGDINLTIDAVELTATKAVWPQPFTVGGRGDNVTVNINNSTIDAGSDGYGIITFNPVALTITNSTVSGYAAIYTREASNSLGSKGSVINVVGSTLIGLNNASVDESNSFSTISIGDSGVTLNVDATSTIKAIANNNPQTIIGVGSDLVNTPISGTNATIAANIVLEGNTTACIVGLSSNMNGNICDNTVKFAEKYADNLVAEGWIVGEPTAGFVTISSAIAQVGDNVYTTLAKAVAAVEDGGTITLVADEVFTKNNYYDNGGWKDGLGYSGDKSFTIDLNNKTIRQDGALNDYLIWVKNDGSKANTITLKNGTLDAGTTAFCAFATASSNKQKITINFENVNLIGNNSNGAVAKIRGGSELNVKAGTVITGKNNYVGIEAVGNNTVVNIYEGAEIYQNGTGSYVGAIVGASYNATMNIYGGYGKSAKCGIIVMSTGATINVSGGEWIANNDGTVANDNNAVLVSQNNRYEKGWACKSILNVTGGTFKGGYNCYSMGPGVEPDDAQINIKGGNFNSNPANYVVAGYKSVEENGAWTVVSKPQALVEFEDAIAQGGNVTLAENITLWEPVSIEGKVVLDLNGKTVTAPLFSAFVVNNGAELTIKNGKVVAYESTVRAIGGKAIIESGEYTSTGTAADSPATYRYSLDCREGGELIINGGTFKSNNGMINVGSTVTINGGKFENIVEETLTRHFAYVSAPLTINDGEFYGKANAGAGGCFFCGAGASGDIQVNGGKFTSLWTTGSVNRIFEVYFGGSINVTGGMFNTNGGIATFVKENTDEATKAAYPYVAK